MVKLEFHIVDVFATGQYSGNQLAVFHNTGALAVDAMQGIARELNFSETTFILNSEPQAGGFPTRIFTPKCELPFAGHPILGTAYVIRELLQFTTADKIVLTVPVGPISILKDQDPEGGERFWMQQNPPVFYETLEGATVAPVLNLSPEDLSPQWPVQEVSTGVPFIIVPLQSRKALQAAVLNPAAYQALIARTQAQAILLFAPGGYTPTGQFSVRVFAEALGIPEDPATGSANGCLAAYLAAHSYLGSSTINVCVEQGYEIGRPSLLWLQAQSALEGIAVAVGGRVRPVARGEFF